MIPELIPHDPFEDLANSDNGVVKRVYNELKTISGITDGFTASQLRISIEIAVEDFLPLESEKTVRAQRHIQVPRLQVYFLDNELIQPHGNNYQFTQKGLDDLKRRGIDTYVFQGD